MWSATGYSLRLVAIHSLLLCGFGLAPPLSRADIPTCDPAPKPAEPRPRPKPKFDPARVKVQTDLPELVAAHNRIRARIAEEEGRTLKPLVVDPKLTEAARIHALDMASYGTLTHEGSDGSTPVERIKRVGYDFMLTGENVEFGSRTVPALMEDWMNSKPHRANILNDFTQIGVARAVAPKGGPFWIAVFGRPWSQPKPEPGEASTTKRKEPAGSASDLVDRINRVREAVGKRPLKVNPRLQEAAERHAKDNASRGKLEEFDSEGKRPTDRVQASGGLFVQLGESSAKDYPTADGLLAQWLKEPAQCAQLLGNYTDIGVGHALDGDNHPYWTLLLGLSSR